MVNCTFNTAHPGEIPKIKEGLKNSFYCSEKEPNRDQKEAFHIKVHGEGGELTVKGYDKGTILVQGKSSELAEEVKGRIRQFKIVEDEGPEISKTEEQIEKKKFLGVDESGKGECFGPLVLACAIVENKAIEKWKNRLSDKDIKDFSIKDLNFWVSKIEEDSNVKVFTKEIKSLEIDYSGLKLNRIMDKGYTNIIKKHRGDISSSCIVIDDYGIGDELKQELKFWEERGGKYIVHKKADEYYITPKLASIIARHRRKEEVDRIIEVNKIRYGGNIYKLKDGARNKETEEWLKAFRKLNPTRKTPAFIRERWSNVEEVLKKYPQEEIESLINCDFCNNSCNFIYCAKRSDYIDFFCPCCGRKLDKSVLEVPSFIIPDTSSLVARVFTTDLDSKNSYFEGSTILLPYKIQQEIDSLPSMTRTGANKEISKLETKENQNFINLVKTEIPFKTQDFMKNGKRDEEIINRVAREENAILTTADDSMASTATNCFRIRVIHPQKWENEKKELLLEN